MFQISTRNNGVADNNDLPSLDTQPTDGATSSSQTTSTTVITEVGIDDS